MGIVITKEMFRSAGMGMFDGLPEKTEKQKKKKNNNNLTAVIPVIDVEESKEWEESKEPKESKDERQISKNLAAKTAWSKDLKPPKKKRKKPVLRRKTSLENNFSDNSMVHKYGCPVDQQHNIHYKPNHKENRLFNFKMRVKLRMQFRNYKSRCLKLLFWILLIVYPSVSRKILMLYKCVEIGDKSYMMWDTQVECYTQTWYLHSVYALVFGVVYILGIPGMFFSLLYQSRHFDTHRRFLIIKANPTRLVKTLKLAREDYWNKGIH